MKLQIWLLSLVLLPQLLVFLPLNLATTRGQRRRSYRKVINSGALCSSPSLPGMIFMYAEECFLSLSCLILACLVGLPVCSLPPTLLLSIHFDTLKVHHVSHRRVELEGGRATMFRYIKLHSLNNKKKNVMMSDKLSPTMMISIKMHDCLGGKWKLHCCKCFHL